MRAVSIRGEGCGGLGEQSIVGKGAQELEMAFTGLVDACENRIDHAKPRAPRDAPCRNAISGTHIAAGIGGCLKCAHYARADRNDAAAAQLRPRDLRRGAPRDAVWLVEGKVRVERGIAARRDPRSMRECCKANVVPTPGLERAPVEREACRRRLERDRPGGNLRPNIPQCQRLGNMRVLDRPAVLRQSCKHRRAVAWEVQLEKARMVEKALDDGVKRAEPEAIAW